MRRLGVLLSSFLLCAAITVVSLVVIDLQERAMPTALGGRALVELSFANSDLPEAQAVTALKAFDAEAATGLMKVLPGGGTGDNDVYVKLSPGDLPEGVSFSGHRIDVQHASAQNSSLPAGRYLVTGSPDSRDALAAWLTQHHVDARWHVLSAVDQLKLVATQSSLWALVAATLLLMMSAALHWHLAQARARAIRVLAGSSPLRVGVEDAAGYLTRLTVVGLLTCLGAAIVLGARHGSVFVAPFLTIWATLALPLLLGAAVTCAVISAIGLPRAEAVARREPDVGPLYRISMAGKVLTIGTLLLTVGPGVDSVTESTETARQQSYWESLAQHAGINLARTQNKDQQRQMDARYGALAREADGAGLVAFSYAFAEIAGPGPGLHFAMVNDSWLSTLQAQGSPLRDTLVLVPMPEVPPQATRYLSENLAETWNRRAPIGLDELESAFHFYRPAPGAVVPLAAGGGGELVLTEDVLIASTPRISDLVDDDFLAAVMSSDNLLVKGMPATLQLMDKHGLTGLATAHVAGESARMQAQYARYWAWMRAFSVAAIIAATVLACLVNAFVDAARNARRDFVLLCGGWTARVAASDRIRVDVLITSLLTLAGVMLSMSRAPLARVAVLATAVLVIALQIFLQDRSTRLAFSLTSRRMSG